ncbi:MAG TPA: histidine phosphatase family protein, partial [Acidimicrobiales bacterium]|nr:histidine phosphatase family protein [Acidimicrobiales bacterium]
EGRVVGLLSSDLRRAVQTAAAVAEGLRADLAVGIDARLRERDVGWVTGMDDAEAAASFPDQMARWRERSSDRSPGGEGDGTLVLRARRALDDASRRIGTDPDGVWMAVSHGGLISVLERAAELGPGGFANLAGRWVLVDAPGRWRLGPRFPR